MTSVTADDAVTTTGRQTRHHVSNNLTRLDHQQLPSTGQSAVVGRSSSTITATSPVQTTPKNTSSTRTAAGTWQSSAVSQSGSFCTTSNSTWSERDSATSTCRSRHWTVAQKHTADWWGAAVMQSMVGSIFATADRSVNKRCRLTPTKWWWGSRRVKLASHKEDFFSILKVRRKSYASKISLATNRMFPNVTNKLSYLFRLGIVDCIDQIQSTVYRVKWFRPS